MSKCCDNLSDNRRKQTKQKGKARAKENCGCIFCDLNLPAVYGRNITHGNAVTCSKTLMNFAPIHQAIVYSPYTLARAFMARIKPEISRRRAMASAVYRPCLSAFLFPFGAPGDIPPCIRHRPFGIAGARHDFRFRVRAPHRGLRCMGNLLRIGLSLWFR